MSRIFVNIRLRLTEECECALPFGGPVEIDESCFGAGRMRGKRGRGASGKTIVLDIFKPNGSVYIEIVPDCKRKTLAVPSSAGASNPEAVIHSDAWRGLRTGWLMSATKSISVSIILTISLLMERLMSTASRAFGLSAKRRLQKFSGLPSHTFYLHLKECGDRFNNRKKNLFWLLLKLLKNNPLSNEFATLEPNSNHRGAYMRA